MKTPFPIDAEARGKVRALKTQIAAVRPDMKQLCLLPSVEKFATTKNRIGKDRALKKIIEAIGRGAKLERVFDKTLVFSTFGMPGYEIIAPTNTPIDDVIPAAATVAAYYFIVGFTPRGLDGEIIGVADGCWSVDFTDHALGRMFQRDRRLTTADALKVMRQAQASAHATDVDFFVQHKNSGTQVLLRAGRGAFIATPRIGSEVKEPDQHSAYYRCVTWIDDGLMRQDQQFAPLAQTGQLPIGEGILLPMPLRWFRVENETDGINEMRCSRWHGIDAAGAGAARLN